MIPTTTPTILLRRGAGRVWQDRIPSESPRPIPSARTGMMAPMTNEPTKRNPTPKPSAKPTANRNGVVPLISLMLVSLTQSLSVSFFFTHQPTPTSMNPRITRTGNAQTINTDVSTGPTRMTTGSRKMMNATNSKDPPISISRSPFTQSLSERL